MENVFSHLVELSTLTTSVLTVTREMEFNGCFNLKDVWLNVKHLIARLVILPVLIPVLQVNTPILQMEVVHHVELLTVRPVMKLASVSNVKQEHHVLLHADITMIQDTSLTMSKANAWQNVLNQTHSFSQTHQDHIVYTAQTQNVPSANQQAVLTQLLSVRNVPLTESLETHSLVLVKSAWKAALQDSLCSMRL